MKIPFLDCTFTGVVPQSHACLRMLNNALLYHSWLSQSNIKKHTEWKEHISNMFRKQSEKLCKNNIKLIYNSWWEKKKLQQHVNKSENGSRKTKHFLSFVLKPLLLDGCNPGNEICCGMVYSNLLYEYLHLLESTSPCDCHIHFCLGQPMCGNLLQACPHCKWNTGQFGGGGEGGVHELWVWFTMKKSIKLNVKIRSDGHYKGVKY